MLKKSYISTFLVIILIGSFNTLQAGEKLEHQLAIINAGGYVSENHITVARFRSLLNQLSYKYIEDRQQIAECTYTKFIKKEWHTRKFTKNYGRDE